MNMGRGCGLWGTKGSARPLIGKIHIGKKRDQTPSGKPLPGGLQVINLDTDQLKDTYHYRLKQALKHEEQGAYLHKKVGVDYAKQILAEEKQLNEKGVAKWIEINRNNHLFDCETLAHACADPEWPGGGVNIMAHMMEVQRRKTEAIIKQKKQGKKEGFERPGWLDR